MSRLVAVSVTLRSASADAVEMCFCVLDELS